MIIFKKMFRMKKKIVEIFLWKYFWVQAEFFLEYSLFNIETLYFIHVKRVAL